MAQELFVAPQQKPSVLSRIGAALGGFGAGVQGRGPEYLAGLQAQREEQERKRLTAMITDAKRTYDLLNVGDVKNAEALIMDRINLINRMGGDPSDTANLGRLIQSGRIQEAKNELSTFLRPFMPVEAIPTSQITETGQRVISDPLTGQVRAEDVAGFRAPAVAPPDQYRPMSAAERTQYGIPQDAPARFNISQNKPEIISGGGSQTTIQLPGEEGFESALYKESVGAQLGDINDQLKQSPAIIRTAKDIGQLVNLLGKSDLNRAEQLIVDRYGMAGINFMNLGPAVEAAQSLISRLAPNMRPEGSGTTSDRDLVMYVNSLPSVMQSQQGRQLTRLVFEEYADIEAEKLEARSLYNRRQIDSAEYIERIDRLNRRSLFEDPTRRRQVESIVPGFFDEISSEIQLRPTNPAITPVG